MTKRLKYRYLPNRGRFGHASRRAEERAAPAVEEAPESFDYARLRHASLVAAGVAEAAVKQEFPADKGQFGGRCNRGACLKPKPTWFNQSTQRFYCAKCARMLNEDRFNKEDALKLYGGPLCFEVKE